MPPLYTVIVRDTTIEMSGDVRFNTIGGFQKDMQSQDVRMCQLTLTLLVMVTTCYRNKCGKLSWQMQIRDIESDTQ